MNPSDRPDHRETPVDRPAGDPVFVDAGESDRWVDHEIRSGQPGGTKDGNRRRRPFGFFRFFRRLVLVGLLLTGLLIAALGTGLYLARHWLRSELERRLLVELARQRIHLTYESASYHYTRGLVLEKVTLYETARREVPLLTCTELGFTFDVIDFAQQEFRGDITTAFTTRDAELTCFHAGGEVATIRNLNLEILGTRDEVSVERFRGEIGDLDFDVEGRILLSREERRHRSSEERDRKLRETDTRKVADFAFFHDVMPWLTVTTGEDGSRPELSGTFVVDPKNENAVTVRGRFSGRQFTWRRIPLDSASVEFAFAEGDKRLVLPDFNLTYEGGLIAGEAVWDSGTHLVDVTRFQSSANLLGLLHRINPSLAPFAAMIVQEEHPLIKATGKLDLKHFWASDLELDYRQATGMTLLLNRGPLDLESISGRFRVAEGGLATESLVIGALGGRFEAGGRATLAESPLRYEGRLAVTGVPLQRVVDFYGGGRELPGMLALDFEGSGGVAMAALNGKGTVSLNGAQLYEVPVIGPIQGLMGSVVPVFGDDRRSEMSASFAITDGVLESEDLEILADGTRVEVAGKLDLSNWQTDFEAEGKLVGALGLVTGLMSKALVVEGSGRVDELDIRLKNVPAEFASDAVRGVFGLAGKGVGLVSDTVGTGLESAQQAAGGALKVTGSVLSGSADAVKNVGQGVANLGQKTVGGGVRAMGDGASLVGETGKRGFEGGAKIVEGGARMIGDGLRLIIPGQRRRDDEEDETEPILIGPPDPGELVPAQPSPPDDGPEPQKPAPVFSD